MGLAAEKWGEAVRATGKAFGETGKVLRATVKTLRETGKVIGETGKAFGATVNRPRETVNTLREIGKVVGATGNGLRDWGRQPENWGATISRRAWDKKILRSGCEPCARWLSLKHSTVARSLMKCGMRF